MVPGAAGPRGVPTAVTVRGLAPSFAHTPEHIEQTLEAATAAFKELSGAKNHWALGGVAARAGRVDGQSATQESGSPKVSIGSTGPAQLAAAGPRVEGAAEYELLVETIYEGYLLHYGAPRAAVFPRGRPGAAGGRPAVRAWAGALVEPG